ncbi:MAG: hypothetical protein GYA17_10285 [Chloroflexi bacterium]|nr:HEAT repeat domain-containing protein [Anaerolineaceae bacterium]NMB88739.1 hypothetical protein [Chloroflexota bacterium]
MNEILSMLRGGDLRSDGRADEAAARVVAQPQLCERLAAGLDETDDVVRARTAHALEKVSRARPDLLADVLPRCLDLALDDPLPMVRWHMAMLLGNLPASPRALDVLLRMLDDPSALVTSWAITSLVRLARRLPPRRAEIAGRLRRLGDDPRASVRNRAAKALQALEEE